MVENPSRPFAAAPKLRSAGTGGRAEDTSGTILWRHDRLIVNYTPDHAVRFDLEGKPVETFICAYRPMEVTVSLGRREVSAESFGRVLGTARFVLCFLESQ